MIRSVITFMASAGAVIAGLESAFVVLLAAAVLPERITRAAALALVLAFSGFVVLGGGNPFAGSGIGDLFVAIGVLGAAAYTVVLKRLPAEPDTLALTTYQLTAAAALALFVVAGRGMAGAGQLPTAVPLRFWLAAALVGMAGFAGSFIIFNSVIGGIGAGPASIILNLIPAFGVLTAMVFLGERLDLNTACGALLVAVAVVSFVLLELRGSRQEPSADGVHRHPLPSDLIPLSTQTASTTSAMPRV